MILVDEAIWAWRGMRWCHLVSDQSYEELHDFAARLGLRRMAFQGDHYDVNASTRIEALGLGASPVPARQLVLRLRAAGLRRVRSKDSLRWDERSTFRAFESAQNVVVTIYERHGEVAIVVKRGASVAEMVVEVVGSEQDI